MPRITIVMGRYQRLAALLLFLFVGIPVMVVAGHLTWTQFTQWRESRSLDDLVDKPNAQSACWTATGELPAECYTVLLATYKRHASVLDAADYFRRCPRVGEVRVVWVESATPVAFPSQANAGGAPVVVDVHHPETSLNERFALRDGARSEGLFSVDDDVRVACEDLDGAHDAWRADTSRLVGFYPRGVAVTAGTDGRSRMRYEGYYKTSQKERYSIVLSKACFVSRAVLAHYAAGGDRQARARAMVADGRNCEDVALQFAAAEYRKNQGLADAAALFYAPKHSVVDYGAWFGGMYMSGISSGASAVGVKHVFARSECLTTLFEIYGAAAGGDALTPLPTTNAVAGRGKWAPANGFEPVSADLWAPLAELSLEVMVGCAVFIIVFLLWMGRGAGVFVGRRSLLKRKMAAAAAKKKKEDEAKDPMV